VDLHTVYYSLHEIDSNLWTHAQLHRADFDMIDNQLFGSSTSHLVLFVSSLKREIFYAASGKCQETKNSERFL
jgi:hypothetical protein